MAPAAARRASPPPRRHRRHRSCAAAAGPGCSLQQSPRAACARARHPCHARARPPPPHRSARRCLIWTRHPAGAPAGLAPAPRPARAPAHVAHVDRTYNTYHTWTALITRSLLSVHPTTIQATWTLRKVRAGRPGRSPGSSDNPTPCPTQRVGPYQEPHFNTPNACHAIVMQGWGAPRLQLARAAAGAARPPGPQGRPGSAGRLRASCGRSRDARGGM